MENYVLHHTMFFLFTNWCEHVCFLGRAIQFLSFSKYFWAIFYDATKGEAPPWILDKAVCIAVLGNDKSYHLLAVLVSSNVVGLYLLQSIELDDLLHFPPQIMDIQLSTVW